MWYTDLEACVDARATGHRGELAVSFTIIFLSLPLMSSSSFSLPLSISNLHHRIYSLLSIQ